MKLFLPSSSLVSGNGALSRHHVPRPTVVGGQVPSSCATVLPPTLEAFFTVGIAEAGNLPSRPRTSRAPACGFELIGCPAKTLSTAWRAASAKPVVENTSATSAIAVAGEGIL